MNAARKRFVIRGVTQGVGFRPAVFRYARGFSVSGHVRNDPDGVTIEVEGDPSEIGRFSEGLRDAAPRLARIESIEAADLPATGEKGFTIVSSSSASGGMPPIPADIALCPDCAGELEDPANRRHQYPFITCTLCGPRYTIVRRTPYDRERTSMEPFAMCRSCAAEYADPADRRFHSETNSCAECGPRIELLDHSGRTAARGVEAVRLAAEALESGRIAAIKGIGGFHLACDASNARAVEELRLRKGRAEKPFAVMTGSARDAVELAELSDEEVDLMAGPVAPIIIARRRPGAAIPACIAPGNGTIGVFTAYSPLHRLLFSFFRPGGALVMTSGNRSEEPIAMGNGEALDRLSGIADVFLLHDREILCRADDSIFRVIAGVPVVFRRGRGIAPEGIRVRLQGPDVLALGGELKNTVAVLAGDHVYPSAHIGDLETVEAFEHFRESMERIQEFCDCRPRIWACDMHPEYLSTKHAEDAASAGGCELLKIQHHHAHIASCMAENGAEGPVIGVSFDGTGYGPDGTVWGGEFLVADFTGFKRMGMLSQIRMPGGAMAIREPFRMAAFYIYKAFGSHRDPRLLDLLGLDRDSFRMYAALGESGTGSPLTSSAGRLFDAVSVLAGVCRLSTFEGQPAMALESAASMHAGSGRGYGTGISEMDGMVVVDTVELVRRIAQDVMRGTDYREVAWKFHAAMADAVAMVCARLREVTGIGKTVLSGGVFQNAVFTRMCRDALVEVGFTVLTHMRIPPNDGGISVGQAVIAREVGGCASRYRCGS